VASGVDLLSVDGIVTNASPACQDLSSRCDLRGGQAARSGPSVAFLPGGPNRITARRPQAASACPAPTSPNQSIERKPLSSASRIIGTSSGRSGRPGVSDTFPDTVGDGRLPAPTGHGQAPLLHPVSRVEITAQITLACAASVRMEVWHWRPIAVAPRVPVAGREPSSRSWRRGDAEQCGDGKHHDRDDHLGQDQSAQQPQRAVVGVLAEVRTRTSLFISVWSCSAGQGFG
jgi:hypothetical protein